MGKDKLMDEIDLKEIVANIAYLIDQRDEPMLKNILVDMHAADIADILEQFDDDRRNWLFSLLKPDDASDVVVELEDVAREDLIEDLDTRRLSEIVDEMDSDDAADVVSELPDKVAEEVLQSIDKQDREEVEKLLRHEEDTAGGIMAMEFIAVNENETTDEAIREIRRKAEEVEEVYNVYVVDDENHLVGVLPLKKLILSPSSRRVHQVMDSDVISVSTEMDQEEVARVVRKYDLVSIPVVNDDGALVGRITVDDIVDVIHEEAAEDLQRMAGISDQEMPQETSTLRISRLRLPWLIVAFFGEMISAYVMSRFEASLNEILAVAFFIPVIMAMGGNSGIQTTTIVVRNLATAHDAFSIGRRGLIREIKVAIFNGIIISLLIFAVVTTWLHQPQFGLVIAMAMMVVIFNAALVGATVPVLLKKFDIDPAIATGPFITTSNDVLGLLIYLSLASVYMKWLSG